MARRTFPISSFRWVQLEGQAKKKWLGVAKRKTSKDNVFDAPPWFSIRGKNEKRHFYYQGRNDQHILYLDHMKEIEVRFEISQ